MNPVLIARDDGVYFARSDCAGLVRRALIAIVDAREFASPLEVTIRTPDWRDEEQLDIE